jgi:hypothetical protein
MHSESRMLSTAEPISAKPFNAPDRERFRLAKKKICRRIDFVKGGRPTGPPWTNDCDAHPTVNLCQ